MKSKRREKIGKRKALAFVILFATLAFVSVGIGTVSAATIYVNPGESIQAAIDAANPGDVIIVRDGIYTENINVNKRLTIRSENGAASTMVEAASTSDHVFEITADYVNIGGFTVKGANGYGKAGIYLCADSCNIAYNTASYNDDGIHLSSSSNNLIANNNCSNNWAGIYLGESSDNSINNNIASNNLGVGIFLDEHSSDNNITKNVAINNTGVDGEGGISLYASDNNFIKGNIVSNSGEDGIYLDWSSYNTVMDNIVSNNAQMGIYLEDSNSNIITNNNISNSSDGGGIRLENCRNNSLSNNNISSNYYDGIILWESCNNTVTNNTANLNNEGGICLDYSNNNTITNNTANENNHSGIHLLWESRNNTVTNNTVNSNNYSGIYLSSSSYNTLTKNTCLNNRHGINLRYSSNYNMLMCNTANSNDRHGICPRNSSNNTLTSNTANSNGYKGINLRDSNNNLIYNNYFNNTNNAHDDGNNIWNIAKTAGTNIIGGSWLGGNYWSDYAGEDLDGDGLGDTLLPYDSFGCIINGGDYLPLVPVRPTISIYTDKTSYTAGERMHLGLDVKNPLDSLQRVSLNIYLEMPTGGTFTLIDSTVTLPIGLDYCNPNFKVFRLPSIPAGTYTWHAKLSDPFTGEIISEDTAEWAFVSTRTQTEEITEVLEQTTVEIDFEGKT